MILPANNISIMDVRNAIGCPSLDLGTLCSKALSGGKSGFAFNISENGGTDGVLINGAKPYYNIFSNNAPAQWFSDGLNIKYRLLRDSNNKYCFKLGAFRNYDSNAVAPTIGFDVDEISFVINDSVPIFVPVTCNVGSYHWNAIDNITKVAISLYNGLGHLETKQIEFATGSTRYSHIFEIPKGNIQNNDKLTARLRLVSGRTNVPIIGLNSDGSEITSQEINCVGVTNNPPRCGGFSLYDTNGVECELEQWNTSLSGQTCYVTFILSSNNGNIYDLYSPYKIFYSIYNPANGTTSEKYIKDFSTNIVPGRQQSFNAVIPVQLKTNDVVQLSMYSS